MTDARLYATIRELKRQLRRLDRYIALVEKAGKW